MDGCLEQVAHGGGTEGDGEGQETEELGVHRVAALESKLTVGEVHAWKGAYLAARFLAGRVQALRSLHAWAAGAVVCVSVIPTHRRVGREC